MNSTRAAIKQKDPCTDWVTHEVTVKRKAATYEIARSKLVEYEQNTDVSTEPESTENMGRRKRKRRQVVMSSEAEDEDDNDINNQASPSPPRPPSTLCMQTPPPTHRSIQTPAPPAPIHGSSTPRRDIRDSMFVRILTLLEEVKDTQRNHGRILQALLQDRHNIANPVCSTPEGFPLKTVNEVDCMEVKLANPTFMSELIAAVADIGGGTADGATRRMMAFLIDHNLSDSTTSWGETAREDSSPSSCLK
ncbi:uncharacterized protein LOC132897687 [Neoarius graeffei]|uniref:uncharacterized protein LOC132897687 n=1 Tax=Neoarius graeffei TaxID=443677 RepID=UPI00298C20F9|nr:uncharacterized protein LOC132897687 [Neoarius graeffei]